MKGGDICMQVENCTTGSVPRKVISHLFGRNKVCTRRIPERVWVCMCRKHYQRVRYRRGADFSVTQIGMVYEQIVRMIFWSRGLENPNNVNQEAITVRSWTFSIRKRELRRLVDANGRDLIPRWIIQSLGDGKTHDDILDIVERLHHEIQQGILKDVPPVEFLPEVVDAYNNPSAQIPNHVNRDSSSELETAAISRAAHLGQTGETSESPVSFTKDSSPLEPVQEEGSSGDRSSETSSSPTPSATFDISQYGADMGYHPQQHPDDQSKPARVYSHGSRSPVDSAVAAYSDSRGSLPYFDSQNPTLPSMSHFDINYQVQAPMISPRGSCDNISQTSSIYPDPNQYGPSESILTDRSASGYMSVSAMVGGSLAIRPADYVGIGTYEGHHSYSATGGFQARHLYQDHYHGETNAAPPGQSQREIPYRESFVLRPPPSGSRRDPVLPSQTSDTATNNHLLPLGFEPARYRAELNPVSGPSPTTTQLYWQSSAYGNEAEQHVFHRHGEYHYHPGHYNTDSTTRGRSPTLGSTATHGLSYHPGYGGEARIGDLGTGSHQAGRRVGEPAGDRE
ncbi:hypothetical protein ACJ41O_005057 [Fusarium nematophilum]